MTKELNTAAPKVVVKKIIHAKAERVFDAWVKPELIEKWLCRKGWPTRAANQPKVGGSYTIETMTDGKASSCSPEASGPPQPKMHSGEYLEIRRPERLVFTWNTPMVKDSRVTVEFRSIGDSTEVIITHELLHSDELRQGHSEGWGICLENLEDILSNQ